MPIILKNIIPQFLEKEKIASSAIWQHEINFNEGEKVQIIAPSGSGKDRKSTRLNSSHRNTSRMPSSA